MSAAKHIRLLFQSIVIWLAFWLFGLPSYYQQYSAPALGVVCTVLSVVICLAALRILLRRKAENRAARAFWCSVYYIATFAILDTLYCGIYLGHGVRYITQYWYLAVFYVTPWLTFVPIERLLRNRGVATSRSG
jgi:hypothetical protein